MKLNIKPLWGGGSDYVEPHVIAIADGVSKSKMRYKKYVKAEEPVQKTINYVSLHISNKTITPVTDFPVTTQLFIKYCGMLCSNIYI